MSEASAHEAIEFQAWGIANPKLEARTNAAVEYSALTPAQQQALQAYSGNWMRDFSQAFVPFVLKEVAEMPRQIGPGAGPDTIGALGAETLVLATLRALAMLEFDEEITNSLITRDNFGQYKPEEHLDNPAGLPLADLLIRVGGAYTPAQARDAQGNLVPLDTQHVQAINAQLASSGYDGPQVQNPTLFRVAPLGLNQFIYGTVEWVKATLTRALAETNLPRRRMLVGTALHGVEDYIAHSNFIEIALNFVLDDPESFPGLDVVRNAIQKRANDPFRRWVDTLYDQGLGAPPGPTPPDTLVARQRRFPVTTGTFGTDDTKISIAHLVLPKVDQIADMIAHGALVMVQMSIDAYCGIFPPGMDPAEKQRLQAEAQQLRGQPGAPTTRQARAVKMWIEGLDAAGIQLPSIVESQTQIPTRADFEATLGTGFVASTLLDAIETNYPLLFGMKLLVPGFDAPSRAFANYVRFKRFVGAGLDNLTAIKAAIDVALTVPLPQSIKDALQAIKQWEAEKLHNFDQKLAVAIRDAMYRTLEKIIGIEGVTDQERSDPQVWSRKVKGFVHDKEGGTFGRTPEHQQAGSPPSHSEICKDHPPHINPVHALDRGSPFFALHEALASSAVQHITRELERITGVLIAGNASATSINDAEADRRNTRAARVHASVATEAGTTGRNLAAATPLLNLIDHYMAHPEDTSWWHSIVLDALRGTPIVGEINQRNQTRGNRSP